jgi:hypothetical protein
MIDNGRAYLIYDCKTPSFTSLNNQKIILKNHIINHEIKRKQHPLYNDTDGYICDEKDNLWHVNPKAGWNHNGLIAFADDVPPALADKNFVTLMDEKSIRDYLKTVMTNHSSASQTMDYIVSLIFKIVHHPLYYETDKQKKVKTVDILAEQDKQIPDWIKNQRKKDTKLIYDKIIKKSPNITIVLDKNKLEHVIGDGFSFVVFNCIRPSYIYPKLSEFNNLTVVHISSSEFLALFNYLAYCNQSENVWRLKKNNYYLTFDAKIMGLGYSPSKTLLNIFNDKGVCDDFMKYLMHPFYYNKMHFKQPSECLTYKTKPNYYS